MSGPEAAFRALPDNRVSDTTDPDRLELELPARQASADVKVAERAWKRFQKTETADPADVALLRDQLQGGTAAERAAAAVVLTRLAPDVATDAPEVYPLLIKLHERKLLGPKSRRLVDRALGALQRAGPEAQLMRDQVREATGR